MKIGFVLDDSLDKPDGVQQYIITLGHWYSLQGHEVHYLVGQTRRRDIPNIHSLSRNVSVTFNQNRMSIPFRVDRRKIAELLSSERFDVLHVQMPYSPILGARIIKAAPKATAIIGTFHILPCSPSERLATSILRLMVRKTLKQFDTVISVSKPAAEFAEKTFKVKSLVQPNVVNVGAFSAGKRIKKYDDGKLNIVFLGRLVERKGCMQLLRVIKMLHEQYGLLTVRVLIGGKGPLEAELKKFVKSNRLGSVVQFCGFISESEKANFLASAHLAVFPSTGGESFGIVLIEAMAAGAEVVIGGNNLGYSSVLGERTDQLIDPIDPVATAKTLKHFITNGRARKRAHSWQQKQVNNYDVKTVGHNLLDIYNEAIAKRKLYLDNENK